MSKYYTPEIEEFHVGFEYEARIPKMESFSEEVFYFNDSHKKLVNRVTLHDNHVRVKHLDREDIESLGFVFKKETESSYVKDNITMHVYDAKRWNTENDTITIFKKDIDRVVGKTIVFAGVVKNKSELKRILKQLEK